LNPLKKLAGQTAIYGLGTILSRLLNYLLVPFYTHRFIFDSSLLSQSDFGIITELYAYVGILMVMLTYGMETSFFRFAQKEENRNKVFSLSLLSLIITTSIFLMTIWFFLTPISQLIGYENFKILIILLSSILAIDILTAIPFAYLRMENKAMRFSGIKFINVLVNIILNFFLLFVLRYFAERHADSFLGNLFEADRKVIYVFISNLLASFTSLILLLSVFKKFRFVWDWQLLKKMLRYTYPLLIIGLAGMINDMGDKILLKHLISIPDGMTDVNTYVNNQLGIYGANFKLAILMTLFVQMFRYAFEPFFFNMEKEQNAQKVYADVMKYFIAFSLLLFLGVSMYLDIFKYFIGDSYWAALSIVPVILMAKLFYGIFVNLSLWYKLRELTLYGAVIGIVGALITLVFNMILVPRFGYNGAAWTHLSVYVSMVLISYLWGRKYYPVPYELNKILLLFAIALLIYSGFVYFKPETSFYRLTMATFFIGIYLFSFAWIEKKFILRIIKK
jgi:O-antigen/teichoic acid export membrane protein